MNRKVRFGLIGKLIILTIVAVVFTAVLLVAISGWSLSNTYENLIMEELKATAEHLDTSVASMNDNGDWTMEDGVLLKGGGAIMDEIEAMLDTLTQETGIDYTIFYGDTRVITTINKKDGSGKLVGTQASSAVVEHVLNGGQEYAASNLNIEGVRYMGYYAPLINSDHSIVGMVFTGRHSADVSTAIFRIMSMLILVAVIVIVAVFVFGMVLNKKISTQMNDVSAFLSSLAGGDLHAAFDEKVAQRKDELGTIGFSTKNLNNKISEIIGQTKEMSGKLSKSGIELSESSDNASQAAMQVSSAVDDISKGAVSQAESIQTAVTETNTLGEGITDITKSVITLNTASEKMKEECDSTIEALDTLLEQSRKVTESVRTIEDTIERTDKSARSISAFTEAINDIASQTNLLSLNASIEAARAGEAGKGFAVVAGEISNLAAQSKESADRINEIVNALVKDTQESVKVMEVLIENAKEQNAQLSITKESMDRMENNIDDVAEYALEIDGKIKELESAKESLDFVIDDLSAISEENAAATQETNASIEELSATFSMVAESADQLKNLASSLTDTIGYFK